MATRIEELVQKLGENADIDKVLEEFKISATQALSLLRKKRGRMELAARRSLAALQTRLVARRYSPFAVSRLCELLQQEKPEFRLKGAMSLLEVSQIGSEKKAARKKPAGDETVADMTAEDATLLETLSAIGKEPHGPAARGDGV